MSEFSRIFKKVGGFQILSQYRKGHVLMHAFASTIMEGVDKKSLEIVRLSAENKLTKKFRKKYRSFIEEFVQSNRNNTSGINPKVIWFCWLQGIEKAPVIVKKCYESIKKIEGYEVRVVTAENIKEYIELPKFIEEKHEKGIIGNAHYADIVRLELLLRHGGTWIDSTVFCSKEQIPEFYLQSDLFVFRILKPGLDGHNVSASNWFISARQNNRILKLTRDLLYEYWKKNDSLIDYYIFHYFFELAMETYPEEAKRIPPASSEPPHALLLRLFDIYDENVYNAIIGQSCFHKLTYKIEINDASKENTFYKHLIDNG